MFILGNPNIEKLKAKNDVPRLIKALEHKDIEIRTEAIRALAELGSSEATPALLALLHDETGSIREAATLALGQLGDSQVQQPMIALLQDSNRSVRHAAALALARVGDAQAVSPLISAISHCDAEECESGFAALAEIGKRLPPATLGSTLTEPLIMAFKDELPSGNELVLENMGWERSTSSADGIVVNKRELVLEVLDELGWQPEQNPCGAIYWMLRDEWSRCAETGPEAIPLLIEVIRATSDDPLTQQKASNALVALGTPAIVPLIAMLQDNEHKIQQIAADMLSQMGRTAVEPLLATLEQADAHQRQTIITILGRIGGMHIIQPLIAALDDPNWGVRKAAAAALNDCKGTLFVMLQQHDDEHISQQAAEALEKIEWKPEHDALGATYCIARKDWGQCVMIGGPAIAPLTTALEKGEHSIQKASAWALGQIGSIEAVPPLIAALKRWGNDDDATIAAALLNIGKWQKSEEIETHLALPLIEAFKDDTNSLQHLTGSVLKELGWQPSMSDTPELVQDAPEAPALIAALSDAEPRKREAAAAQLVKLGSSALRPLIAAIHHANQDTQKGIVSILVKIGRPAVKPLIAVLKDDDPNVRGAAAVALGRIGDIQALKPLTFALRDTDPRVSKAVVWSLRRIGILALESDEPQMRTAAAWVLGRVGTPQAVPSLIAALKQWEESELEHAASALVHIGKRMESTTLQSTLINPLISGFREETNSRQQAVTHVLEQIGWKPG
jgi:HEAT repeat protein